MEGIYTDHGPEPLLTRGPTSSWGYMSAEDQIDRAGVYVLQHDYRRMLSYKISSRLTCSSFLRT